MVNLKNLVDYVFDYSKGESILIVYDIPAQKKDNLLWKERREMAKEWSKLLNGRIAGYDSTYANNSELPEICYEKGDKISFNKLFSEVDIVILLNEFSATAPMHRYAKRFDLRVASMPGFSKGMIPALEVDYSDVAKKVSAIEIYFRKSDFVDIIFQVKSEKYNLHIDYRKRKAIRDDGNCRKKGTVINLPGGECFLSPYDEKDSKTNGYLPIEQEGGVTVYKIENNHIVDADKKTQLLQKIKQDPAVGNIAEMAFGVLSLYGIKPSNRVLLDEKLGMHIALGRDDHFGGSTGISSFKKKENVWHQDFVYIEEIQPKIKVKEARIGDKLIIKEGKYMIF